MTMKMVAYHFKELEWVRTVEEMCHSRFSNNHLNFQIFWSHIEHFQGFNFDKVFTSAPSSVEGRRSQQNKFRSQSSPQNNFRSQGNIRQFDNFPETSDVHTFRNQVTFSCCSNLTTTNVFQGFAFYVKFRVWLCAKRCGYV